MKGKWFLLGCLTSVGVLVLMFFLLVIGISSVMPDASPKKVTSNSWLWLPLAGNIQEYFEYDDTFMPNMDVTSCHDIVAAIQQAETDDHIKGILLEPYGMSTSMVIRDRIGNALKQFQASGKPVYAYLENASDGNYYLASYADKIFMPPSNSSALTLTGVGGSYIFYKTMLSKIGIHFEVFQAGDYKGAGETYSRDSMSPYMRKNLEGIIDGIYEYKLQAVSERREGLDYDSLKQLYEGRENFFITPDKALEYKLIDELKYRDDLLTDLDIDRDHLVKFSRYNIKPSMPSLKNVAVVYAEGMITNSTDHFGQTVLSNKKIDKAFDAIQDDPTIKAVVLRINSPGGSALESDKIWNRILDLKKDGLPVVVSMGGVAASGGYYIACPADYVFAEPATITGSIGVIAIIPVLKDTGDMIGVKTDGVRRGKFAEPFNPWKDMTPEFKGSMRDHIQIVYTEFKQRVSEGRKIDMDQVQEIAQGKVYTSAMAKDIGLIDEVGTLHDAIVKASILAETDGFGTVYYPEKRSLFEELLKDKFNIPLSRMDLARMILPEDARDEAELLLHVIEDDPVQALMPCEVRN